MPQKTIDYYFVPQSPWAYLGHTRLVQLAQKYGAHINVLPMDLGKIFPVSGGLPLAKRAPQCQANRLVELARFRDHLGLPLHVHPQYFPVAGDPAALVIIAVQTKDGWQAALAMASKVLGGVWADERNIAHVPTLKAMLAECGLPESRYEDSLQPKIQALYDHNTQAALNANVFGAPTYIVDGELFWGQDRLDFVDRKLAA
jgi:carboxymethylenebutenolidase